MRTDREAEIIRAAYAVMAAMDRRLEIERNKTGRSTAEFLAAAEAVNVARERFTELADSTREESTDG